jgi:hypothetical protein
MLEAVFVGSREPVSLSVTPTSRNVHAHERLSGALEVPFNVKII